MMWDESVLPTPASLSNSPPAELCQYLHTLHRWEFAEPELRLMLVVLQDALRCLTKYAQSRNEKGRTVFQETEKWVFATAEDGVFSFNSICEALGLDPGYIRKGVTRLTKDKADANEGLAKNKGFVLAE
jgi:hypothetical protein